MRCRHLRICVRRFRTRKSTGWCLKNTSPFYRPCAASMRSVCSAPRRMADFPLRSLIRDLRSQHYDFAIDFQGLLKTAALGFLSGARKRLGFSRGLVREFPAHWFYNRTQPKPQGQFHVLQLNRMLAGLTGAVPVSAPLEFRVPENDSRLVESMLRKEQLTDFVVINPGGGWSTKRWSLQKYGDLTKKITVELGLPVVLTTGPGEETYYQAIADHCRWRACPFISLFRFCN